MNNNVLIRLKVDELLSVSNGSEGSHSLSLQISFINCINDILINDYHNQPHLIQYEYIQDLVSILNFFTRGDQSLSNAVTTLIIEYPIMCMVSLTSIIYFIFKKEKISLKEVDLLLDICLRCNNDKIIISELPTSNIELDITLGEYQYEDIMKLDINKKLDLIIRLLIVNDS